MGGREMKIEEGKFNASVVSIWAGKYDIEIVVDTDVVETLTEGDYLILCVHDDLTNNTILSPWIVGVDNENCERVEDPTSLWEIVEDRAFIVLSKGVGPNGYVLEIVAEDVGDENDNIFERLSEFAEEINGL
jgi:hypothetical protein